MSISHSLRHRRAVAAALRRSPEPNPQLGFSPTFSTPGSTPTPRPDQPDRPGRPGAGGDSTTTVSNDDLPTGRPTTTRGTTSATGTDTSTSDTTATSAATTQRLTTVLPPNTTAAPATTAARITTSSARTTASSFTTDVAPPPPTTTTETQDDPGMSTGAIVGGIGAGIVAIAVLGFGAAWLVRRARKRKQDAAFDPTEFRKSAMLINEPTHQDTVDRGFNPAPNMSEGRGGASFGGPPGPPSPYGAGGYPGDNRAGFGSYGPGQGQPQYGAPSPVSPHSGNPMFAPNPYVQHPYSPAGYNQSPFSPVDPHSPMAEYYQGPYQQQQHPYAQPNTPAPGSAYPVLTRQGSNGSQQSQNQGMQRGPIPNDDYVDLNRSSVSPFQAAQYAEISRRLNPNDGRADAELPPLPKPNPFSDPSLPPTPVEASFATDNRQEKQDSPEPRPSADSLNNIVEAGIPDFPAPPSPAHTTSSRYRVDSTPPLLPEINVQARVSYNAQNFDAAQGAAMSPVSTAGFTAPASTMPAKPSPLASSFGATTPHAQRTEFAEPAAPADAKKGRQSMYDADDAYGGF